MAFVQSNGNSQDSSTTSITVSLTGVAAGNLIVVGWTRGGTTVDGDTVTDSLGNKYVRADSFRADTTNSQGLSVWVAKNVASGNPTITAQTTSSHSFRRIVAAEYSGRDVTTPVDVAIGQFHTGSTATDGVTSTAATPVSDGCDIVGVVMDTAGTTTINPGTGFTERQENGGLQLEDKNQSTAASVAATWTFLASHNYVAFMVALRPQVASSSVPVFVQEFHALAGEVSSVNVTVPAGGVAAGNLLVVSHVVSSTTQTVSSITDTGGNTYTIEADVHDAGSTLTVGVAWSLIGTSLASGDTITVNFASGTNSSVSCVEFSGIAASSPRDKLTSQVISSDNLYSSGLTSAVASGSLPELVVGIHGTRAVARTFTPASPFSTALNSNFNSQWKHVVQYRGVNTVAQYESIGAIDSAASSTNIVITFKAAASAFSLDASPGSYTVTGADTQLSVAHIIEASLGTYAITGDNAGLLADRVLAAVPGAYVVTGAAADLATLGQFSLDADAGAYTTNGTDALLAPGYVVLTDSGAYAISGADAGLIADQILSAEPGAYVVSGRAAQLVYGAIMVPGTVFGGDRPTPESVFGGDRADAYAAGGDRRSDG